MSRWKSTWMHTLRRIWHWKDVGIGRWPVTSIKALRSSWRQGSTWSSKMVSRTALLNSCLIFVCRWSSGWAEQSQREGRRVVRWSEESHKPVQFLLLVQGAARYVPWWGWWELVLRWHKAGSFQADDGSLLRQSSGIGSLQRAHQLPERDWRDQHWRAQFPPAGYDSS